MSHYENELYLTPKERKKALILVVETDPGQRHNMRSTLQKLGFGGITDVPSHAAAIEKIQTRPVTHIIFDAKKTNMPPRDFVSQALELDSRLILIPTSFEPSVDDVFDLLCLGARGYLVKPFTMDTVDAAVIGATKGEPIAESVRQAKDRNEALIAILMSSLDKVATLMRQAKQFETAEREVPRALRGFRVSADLAQTFAKGGEEGLIKALQKFCIDRSKGPASRLGRLRKRLKTSRKEEAIGA